MPRYSGGSGEPPIRLGIDARGISNAYRGLHHVSKKSAHEMLETLKSVSQRVAEDAKAEVGGASTTVPGSIRVVSRAGSRGHVKISVRAGGARAPLAEPLEHGGKPGEFRHPLFGDKNHWYAQPAHPYLLPSLKRNLTYLQAKIEEALTQLFEKYGYTVR